MALDTRRSYCEFQREKKKKIFDQKDVYHVFESLNETGSFLCIIDGLTWLCF